MELTASDGATKFAIDDEDFDLVRQFIWCPFQCRTHRKPYLKSGVAGLLHRYLTGAPSDKLVDHIDGDSLNNRRRNLRLCSRYENGRNRGKNRNNTSGLKGVSWHKQRGLWRATITAGGKQVSLGLHESKERAFEAYSAAARELHGEFARTT